jgi:hypothetical protein
VRLSTRIAFALAAYYLVASFGYLLTGTIEVDDGFPLLLMASAAIALLGGYTFLAVRRAEREAAAQLDAPAEAEPHIGSTIWPFGFAVAAVVIVVGITVTPWILIVGALLFVAAALGWFGDVRHQWRHGDHDSPVSQPVEGADPKTTAEEVT